ncbi:unnamed protein product [Peronospora destructor]|uniref:GAG-pre-integrase domain-containing protein n=1 Tax=Peronospora destructor TaxID=86335 RepID=A0AAV0V349_9STRA|nr:unnamed protein product [Peronospora destructor]
MSSGTMRIKTRSVLPLHLPKPFDRRLPKFKKVVHLWFAHLAYDIVERMASDPASGIRLTDKERPPCLTCAQSKQKRNKQSQQDTGVIAPIDRVGGVICSDIKGPITPWIGVVIAT